MINKYEHLLEIFDKHKTEFVLKLSKEMHDKFFQKYVYIQGEDHAVAGYVLDVSLDENQYTNEIRLNIKVIDNGYTQSGEFAVHLIKYILINDTKEEVLLEKECMEE